MPVIIFIFIFNLSIHRKVGGVISTGSGFQLPIALLIISVDDAVAIGVAGHHAPGAGGLKLVSGAAAQGLELAGCEIIIADAAGNRYRVG